MNRLLYIIFLLVLIDAQLSFGQGSVDNQPIEAVGYSSAVLKGSAYIQVPAMTKPTCVVFTYDPRVEKVGSDNYYKVDIYVMRPKGCEWAASKRTYFCSGREYGNNSLGAFGFGLGLTYQDKFNLFSDIYDIKSAKFIPNPELTKEGADEDGERCVPPVVPVGTGIAMMGTGVAGGYVMTSSDDFVYRIILEEAVPYCVGTMQIKIVNGTGGSCMALKTTACGVTLFGNSELPEVMNSGGHIVSGWLDGKNPDIPLVPEEIVKPDAPVLASSYAKKLCYKSGKTLNAAYSVMGLPAKAEGLEWTVSETAGGSQTAKASIKVSADKLSSVVTYSATGTFYVNVRSKAGSEYSAWVSTAAVAVYPSPALTFKDGTPPASVYAGVSAKAELNTATGGVVTYKYGWILPNPVPEASGSSALSYSAVMTAGATDIKFQAYVVDGNGCSDTTGVRQTNNIGNKPTLNVAAEITNQLCVGGAAILSVKSVTGGTPGYTYSWALKGGAQVGTGSKIMVENPGTYVVTVKDKATPAVEGTAEIPVSVTADNAPVVASNILTVKANKNITLGAAASGGTPGYKWAWSPAAKISGDTAIANPLTIPLTVSQTYTTYVIDSKGCVSKKATVQANIHEGNGIDVTIDPLSIVACKGNSVRVRMSVNGKFDAASAYSYSWSSNSWGIQNKSEFVFRSDQALDTTVTVTVSSGSYKAMQKISIKVKDFVAPALAWQVQNSCVGTNLSVTVAPVGVPVSWTLKGTSETLTGNGTTYALTKAGTYDVKVIAKSSDGQCASDTLSMGSKLKVNTAPQNLALSLKSGMAGTICGDKDILLLNTLGTDSTKWYKVVSGVETEITAGRNKSQLEVGGDVAYADNANYKVKAWNGACDGSTPVLSLTKMKKPIINRLAIADTCNVGRVVATTTNVAAYSWTIDGTKRPDLTGNTATIARAALDRHTVLLSLANGACKKDTTFRVNVFEKPDIDFVNTGISCEGDVLTTRKNSSGTVTYSWYKNGLPITGYTDPSYALSYAAGSSSYKLDVVATAPSPNGCKDTASFNFVVNEKPVLAWKEGFVPPETQVANGDPISVEAVASKGTGSYKYHYEKPSVTSESSKGNLVTVADAFHAPCEFMVIVKDGKECLDTLKAETPIKGASLIVDAISREAYACLGGSAILSAKVRGAGGRCTYEWHKEGSSTVECRDSIFILKNISGAMGVDNLVYTVDVKWKGKDGDKEVVLAQGSGNIRVNVIEGSQAPVVTIPIKVLSTVEDGQPVLIATAKGGRSNYSGNFRWRWTPSEYLLANEDTIQFPQTQKYQKAWGTKKFGVYAIDDFGCVSNPDTVTVQVNNNALEILIDPATAQICLNNSQKLTVKAVTGTLTGITSQWVSSGDNAAHKMVAFQPASTQALFRAPALLDSARMYSQAVYVSKTVGGVALTSSARNTVNVINKEAPKLAFMQGSKYCSSDSLRVSNIGKKAQSYTWLVDNRQVTDGNPTTEFWFDAPFYAGAAPGNYNVKMTAMSTDGCLADTISTTVYQTPQIISLTPRVVTINKGQTATTVAVINPTAGVTGAWTPAADVASSTATTMTTIKVYEDKKILYTVTNSSYNKCIAVDTFTVNMLPDPKFMIDAGADAIACAGSVVNVKVHPSDAAAGKTVQYSASVKGKDAAGKDVNKTLPAGNAPSSADYSFNIVGLDAGFYTLYVKGVCDSKEAADSMKITMNPAPTIALDRANGIVGICGKAEYPATSIDLTLGGGSSWKVYYKLNGTAQPGVDISTPKSVITVSSAGLFQIDSVVNESKCKISGVSLPKLTVADSTPVVAFATSVADSICAEGVTDSVRISITGSNAYPMYIFYQHNGNELYAEISSKAGAKLPVSETGSYTLARVQDAKGCLANITGSLIQKDIQIHEGGEPDMTLVAGNYNLCAGGEVIVPLTVNGGKPSYTIQYMLGSEKGTATIPSGQNYFKVNKGGKLTLTEVKDVYGCTDRGIVSGDVNILQVELPTFNLAQNGAQVMLCTGGGSYTVGINSVAGGSPDWKLYYRIGTQKDEILVTAADNRQKSFKISAGGQFVVDSIRNAEGCVNKIGLPAGIKVVDDRPTAKFTVPGDQEICMTGGSANLPLTLTNAVSLPLTLEYMKNDGVMPGQPITAVDKAALNITATGKYSLVKITDKNGCVGVVRSVAAGDTVKNITVGELDLTVKINNAKAVCAGTSGMTDIPLIFTGGSLVGGASGPFEITYNAVLADGTVLSNQVKSVTLAEAKAGTAALKNMAPGTYTLIGMTEIGGCSGKLGTAEGDYKVKVGQMPSVAIDRDPFGGKNGLAANEGDEFALSIKLPKTSGATYAWSSDPAGEIPASGDKVTARMGTKDIVFVLKGDKDGCVAADTVTAYRIPDAPEVAIDTNNNHNSIKISWKEVTGATGYKVMANKWDGYAVAKQYSEKASKTSADVREYTLATGALDTLEFFYITASRQIAALDNKIFVSRSSDTVGYFKQELKSLKGGGANLISYPFDMSDKGIVTGRQLCDRMLGFVNGMHVCTDGGINAFNFALQAWELDLYYDWLGGWDGTEFDLKPGKVYRITITSTIPKIDLLMYGKLPQRFKYDLLLSSGKYADSFILSPLAMVASTKRQTLGNQIPNINTVSVWDFMKQSYDFATWYDWMMDWDPTEQDDKVLTKSWMPVRVVVIDNVYNWSK